MVPCGFPALIRCICDRQYILQCHPFSLCIFTNLCVLLVPWLVRQAGWQAWLCRTKALSLLPPQPGMPHHRRRRHCVKRRPFFQ